MTEPAGVGPPEVADDTLIATLRRDRPDVARLIFELNKTVGHAGPGAVFNEELRDPEEQSEFDRLSRADQMAQIKETFMGALEQRAVGRIQRRTEQIQNPEEVGGEQMNLLREKRQQFYSDFKAWAESRFNDFIQVLAHVQFGSRKSTLYPGKGRSGMLIGHVKSIAYSRSHKEYFVVVIVPCYDKTRRNPYYEEEVEVRSENRKCDFARLLVLWLAIRQAFMLPLEEAHASNDFRIRSSMKDLSLFGSMISIGGGSSFISDENPTSDSMSRYAFNRIARILQIPEDYMTPKSARQAYAMDRALDYISNNADATWRGCVATAQSSDNWLSEAVEHYLKGPGNELWKCLERVRRYRSLHPGCGYVDARKYFLLVSQYSLLPGYRDFNTDEKEAIRVFADEATKAYRKRQESIATATTLQADDYEQKGNAAAAAELRKQVKSRSQISTRCSATKTRTQLAAENTIKANIISEAIGRTIPDEYPKPPELEPQVIDVMQTYTTCMKLTLCQLRCQKEKLISPKYRLYPGAFISCPITDCTQEFDTSQWEGLKQHMLQDHLTVLQDGSGVTCKECGSESNDVMHNWQEWVAHVNGLPHTYQICWDCKALFATDDDINSHGWDHDVSLRLHALCPMDSISFVCADPPNPPCGCLRTSCVFQSNTKLQKLLTFLKEDEEIFNSVARTVGSVPDDRRALTGDKRRAFVRIATDLIKQASNGILPENTEHCLTTWFEEYGNL